MKNFRTIEEYILNIGIDLRNCDLSGVDVTKSDLRNILLPDDKELFQKVKNKSLYKVLLPSNDYSKYNFNEVNINGTVFTEDSKLPKNKDLFQTIYNKELYETKLPILDMNDYNFEDIKIIKTVFTQDSITSNDKDIFQKIYNKSLYNTILPIGDYSKCDLSDVCIVGTNFQENSILPQKANLFQIVRDKSVLNTELPIEVINKLNMYNLKGVEINLTKYKINIIKMVHLYEKYKNNERMEFPQAQLSFRKGKSIYIKK